MTVSEAALQEETDYLATLDQQTFGYAWCLEHIGGCSPKAALASARAFYVYQPPSRTYRTLVFHDDAWHWAMLQVKGERYWEAHPEFATATPDYERACRRYDDACAED